MYSQPTILLIPNRNNGIMDWGIERIEKTFNL
jgi:hypothetical protein